MDELLIYMNSIDEEIFQKKIALNEYDLLESGIGTWEERYKTANILEKKALLNQIIDRVTFLVKMQLVLIIKLL